MEVCDADGYLSSQSLATMSPFDTDLQLSVNKGLIENKESSAVKQAQFYADQCDCVYSLITKRDGVVNKRME